ncbi:asparagine synthetase B family protein [Altererythrobacter lauratis]|uniref:asparagine synthase (glutamine-hydrolyzing) n=1 Tax=Alteraurantiacibacter lauratis TaxID=2054627 RepID=A0ABV7EF66_9SPHN
MSGIAAIFHADGRPADAAAIRAMTQAMAYRGPDGIVHHVSGPVALGHLQLLSTAEQGTGPQIAASDDGQVHVAMDGYLTNPDELRADLSAKGYPTRNRSDVEIALRAYEAWGTDCAGHLEGEFAFVLWDGRQRMVFCARDHQGLRPLLYHWARSRLLVASDAAAILAVLENRPQPNIGFLAEYLTGQFYTREETAWTGISRLPQACAMTVANSGPKVWQYWSLPLPDRPLYRHEADYVEHYRALLADSVRRTARTNRPLAIEASGGLDSTALFCMAVHLERTGAFPAPSIRGYTLAGPAGTGADEVRYPRAVAEELGVQITERPYFMPPLSWFDADANRARDLPLMPNGIMSRLEEEAMVADGCRACINGVGGDQWLDGSPYYYAELVRHGAIDDLWDAAARDIAAFGWRQTARMAWRFGAVALLPQAARTPARRLRESLRPRPMPELEALLAPEAQAMLAQRRARHRGDAHPDHHTRLKLSKWNYPYWSTMFDHNSRQAAQAGLSQRHPMLTRAYISFMASVPEHFLLQGGQTKQLHRKALAGILPDVVRLRTDKAWTDCTYENLCESIIARLEGEPAIAADIIVARAQRQRICERYRNAAIDSDLPFTLWSLYAITTMLIPASSEPQLK